MLRTAALACMVLAFVVATPSLASDAPPGYDGVWYKTDPVDLYGELPQDTLTVEAGTTVQYYFFTTDQDTVEYWDEGTRYLTQLIFEATYPDTGRTEITSCQQGTYTFEHISAHEADDDDTNVWRLTGQALAPLETTQQRVDEWWADGNGTDYVVPEQGDTVDGDSGPENMTVTITPNRGWVYGYVTRWGNPYAGGTVKLLVGAEQVGQAATDNNGYYKFAYREPGDYTVKASVPGMPPPPPQSKDVTVVKGAGSRADFAF